ncbi:MAG: FHA domain-containing protein [Planctomycetota bacterium]
MSQIIYKFEGRQEIIQLDKDVISFGRSSDNSIVIKSEKVSRKHAEIRKDEESFIVVDLASSNGTYVNGNKVSERKLEPGDIIKIGDALIIFERELTPEAAKPPESPKPSESFQPPEPAQPSLADQPPVAEKPPEEQKPDDIVTKAGPQVIFKNEGQVKLFPLDKGIISIGRIADNTIVISSEKISRRHAEIKQSGERYVVVDLDSQNGICVNGEKVKERELNMGDEITIGDAVIIFGNEIEHKAPAPAGVGFHQLGGEEFLSKAVKSALGSIVTVAVVLLIVALFIFYYAWKSGTGDSTMQNLIERNASFEINRSNSPEPLDWSAPEEFKKYVKVTNSEKQSGEKSLMIDKSAQDKDIYCEVTYDLSISGGQSGYVFGGWVKCASFSKSFAGFKISWFKEGEILPFAENFTELVYSPNQWQSLSETAVPPAQASFGRFSCVALNRAAKTYFDNAFVNRSAESVHAPVEYEIGDPDMKLSVRPNGVWRLEQRAYPILLQGELIIESDGVAARQGFSGAGKVISSDQGSIKLESQMVHPETLNWVKVQEELGILPTLSINYSAENARASTGTMVSVAFQIPLSKARQTVRLLSSNQLKEKSYYDDINEPDIIELNLDLPDRVVVIKYAKPVRVRTVKQSETLEFIQTFPGNVTSCGLEFSQRPLLGDSTAAIEDELKKAAEFSRQSQPGKAIEIYNNIMRQIDPKHEIYQKAVNELSVLESSVENEIKDIAEAVHFARILNDNKMYASALLRARQLNKTYKNTKYELEAQRLAEQIESETREKENAQSEASAKKILATADNCRKEKNIESALWLYGRVIECYPNSSEAEESRQKIAEIKDSTK